MIPAAQVAEIRRLVFAEHWRVGPIAVQLDLHPDTVRRALATERFARPGVARPSALDPYRPFLQATLEQYPRLRATRLFEMVRSRGYPGAVGQVRRAVRRLRPAPKAVAYLRLHLLPGEQGQADWGSFGTVTIGRATRRLSAFVLVLSWSRALHAVFMLDQSLESFLRGHVEAFGALHGVPRVLLYDNMKSAVLERQGDVIRFHPRLLELCGHYHFVPRPCAVGAAWEKGRVERAIRYLREAFFAARHFRDVEDLNQQFVQWRDTVAYARPVPGDPTRTVAAALAEEQPRLLPLPAHPFPTALVKVVRSGKTPYIRFDRNWDLDPAHPGANAAHPRGRYRDGPPLRRDRDRGRAPPLLRRRLYRGEPGAPRGTRRGQAAGQRPHPARPAPASGARRGRAPRAARSPRGAPRPRTSAGCCGSRRVRGSELPPRSRSR
jgi:transposase